MKKPRRLGMDNSYLYDYAKKRAIELDKASHLPGEAKVEGKFLQHEIYQRR
jgi:hypothetical protein